MITLIGTGHVFELKEKVKEKEEREHRKQTAEKRLKEAKEAEDEELMYKYSKQVVRLTDEIINESKIRLLT